MITAVDTWGDVVQDFSLDPERLRASGRALGETGRQAGGGRRSVPVAARGAWGSDEVGQEFRRHYQEVAELAERATRAVAHGLERIGTELEATADDTERTDRAQADDLTRLLEDLGGRPWG